MTNLQKKRLEKNLSQSQFAKISGVAIRSVQHYEQGTRSIDGAKLDTLCTFAQALDCDISDILENKELIKKFKSIK